MFGLVATVGLSLLKGGIDVYALHQKRKQTESIAKDLDKIIQGIDDPHLKLSWRQELFQINSQAPTTPDLVTTTIQTVDAVLQRVFEYIKAQNLEQDAQAQREREHLERIRAKLELLRKQQAEEHREDAGIAQAKSEELMQEDRYVEAISSYESTIHNLEASIQAGTKTRDSVKNNFADNYLRIGCVCRQIGMARRAIEYLEKGLEFRQSDRNIHAFLGISYLDLGKYEQAESHFQISFHLSQQSHIAVYLSFTQGMIAKRAGQTEEANRLFKLAIGRLDFEVFHVGQLEIGCHNKDFYLLRAEALSQITGDDEHAKYQRNLEIIDSCTEALRLLPEEIRYSVDREKAITLRAQAYVSLAEYEQGVTTSRYLFAGDNILLHIRRPRPAGRPTIYYPLGAAERGEQPEEQQIPQDQAPIGLEADSDEEVEPPERPVSTRDRRVRYFYSQTDIVAKAIQDANASLQLNPYSREALAILAQYNNAVIQQTAQIRSPVDRAQKEAINRQRLARLHINDYEIAQRFEKAEGGIGEERVVIKDPRRAAMFYQGIVDRHFTHNSRPEETRAVVQAAAARIIQSYTIDMQSGRESNLTSYLNFSFYGMPDSIARLRAIISIEQCRDEVRILDEEDKELTIYQLPGEDTLLKLSERLSQNPHASRILIRNFKKPSYKPAHCQVLAMATLPDGRLITGGGKFINLHLVDPLTGESAILHPQHTGAINALTVLDTGSIVSGGYDSINIWSPTGAHIRKIENYQGCVNALTALKRGVFVSAGTWAAAGGIYVWFDGGVKIAIRYEHKRDEIWALTTLRDGTTFASGHASGKVHIWSTAGYSDGEKLTVSEDPIRTLDHGGTVYALLVLPNNLLVSAGSAIKIWDTTTWKFIRAFTDFPGNVRALAFFEHENCLIAGSDSGSIYFWDMTTGKKIGSVGHGTVDSPSYPVRGLAVLKENSLGPLVTGGENSERMFFYGKLSPVLDISFRFILQQSNTHIERPTPYTVIVRLSEFMDPLIRDHALHACQTFMSNIIFDSVLQTSVNSMQRALIITGDSIPMLDQVKDFFDKLITPHLPLRFSLFAQREQLSSISHDEIVLEQRQDHKHHRSNEISYHPKHKRAVRPRRK